MRRAAAPVALRACRPSRSAASQELGSRTADESRQCRATGARLIVASPRSRTRLLFAALLAIVGCASAPPGGSTARAPELRVMTYNIFAGKDLERRSNLARVAALIDSLGIDVAFLQEVDRRTARSGHVDQPAVLAELTGFHVRFGRAFDFDGGEYGNAILTRWPVRTSRVVPLVEDPRAERENRASEPRSLLHVVIGTPGGEVHLLNTHLDHGAEPSVRHAQLLQLMAYVAEAVPRAARIVLGGDLNAQPDTREVRALMLLFEDAWPACGAGDGHTFRSDRPTRRIDYILLAGVQCSGARVPDVYLSDHRPVIVDVRLLR